MTHRHPYPSPALQEVINRNHAARRLITTFTRSASTLDDLWQHVTAALNDTPALVAEITRLRSELAKARLNRANIIAAARATLTAHSDGERDPLYYLRDELIAQETRSAYGKPGRPDGAS